MRNKQVTRIWKQWELVLLLLVLGWGMTLVSVGNARAKGEATYKVVMTKNDRLCSYMRDVLNKGLEQYGSRYHVGKFNDAVFAAFAWSSLGEGFDYHGEVARFDINNDGTTDVVVRQETSAGRDITVQRIFIFKEDQFPESAKKRKELEHKAVGSVDLLKVYEFRGLPQKTFQSPPVLKGKEYYEGLSAYVYIYPLRFENATYLLLKRSPDSGPDPYWILVAKYLGGKIRSADSTMMEDICYLK